MLMDQAPRMSLGRMIMSRPLYEIASEILRDPAVKPALWCAGPYLRSMRYLDNVSQYDGADSGRSVVLYALDNLKAYRGETARRVKAELRAML
jgi:hypothetical protein